MFNEMFEYSEESKTGLKWKTDRVDQYGRVTAKAGNDAGCLRFYKDQSPRNSCVYVNGKSLYCNRVIWIMFNGEIPDNMLIDHFDGNPHNNKIDNLRIGTNTLNSRNMKKLTTNTSGVTGVSFSKSANTWRACWHNGKGRQSNKSFSVNKLGYDEAFRLACEYREKILKEESEIKYTERHGK